MIDLQVRTELGDTVARGDRGFDWTQEFIDLDRSVYPLLSGVCAYLDTVFNQRQVPMLLEELDRLPEGRVLSEASRGEIRRLCSMVSERSHCYLWFVGD
ncbi:hypothetical protein BDK92_6254 [Micromonospora pisi]|uniref:Uncharacterized protein n=1 Tax=Micromonospora pisi TaxID=589240 RepID=A0A495JU34_9ACTN|nr:hypothetical protein [Micromonospora pisi]RKR91832.1 hypothetical protein BDK92_6254 [Micromonospora pisi]